MRRLLLTLCAVLLAAAAAAQDEGGYPEPQGPGYGTVTFNNQTAFEVDFSVDGAYACRAWAGSSCATQVSPGTHYLSGRTVEATPRESYETVAVADGGTTEFTVSGGGSAPTGYGAIEARNGTVFPLEVYIDGAYGCRAEASGSCTAQASVGTHSLTARTVEATPRESSLSGVEVVEGGTTAVDFGGGGAAPTGYGAIEVKNETAFALDISVDGVYACRAEAASACTAQANVGTHAVTARTLEATPRDSRQDGVEVAEGGTTTVTFAGGGQPADPAATTNAQTGSIVFDNKTDVVIDFSIDGVFACRAFAYASCTAAAAPGTRSISGRTGETRPREVTGTAEVPAGGETTFTVTGPAAAAPGPARPPEAAGAGAAAVEFQNQTGAAVDFFIDGAFLCRAAAGAACTAAVPPGGGRAVTIRPAR